MTRYQKQFNDQPTALKAGMSPGACSCSSDEAHQCEASPARRDLHHQTGSTS